MCGAVSICDHQMETETHSWCSELAAHQIILQTILMLFKSNQILIFTANSLNMNWQQYFLCLDLMRSEWKRKEKGDFKNTRHYSWDKQKCPCFNVVMLCVSAVPEGWSRSSVSRSSRRNRKPSKSLRGIRRNMVSIHKIKHFWGGLAFSYFKGSTCVSSGFAGQSQWL